MFALDSLRLEKGYRAWKGDLSTDYTVLQGGLDRFVKWDKPDFRGKAALLEREAAGREEALRDADVDAGDCDAPYMSTLWHDGKIVGETTSGGWGYRAGQIDRARHAARRSRRARHEGRSRDLRRALSGHRPAGRAAVGRQEREIESLECRNPRTAFSGILPSGKDGWEVHFAAWPRKEAGEDIIMLSVGDHDFDTPRRDGRGLRPRRARRPPPLHAAARHAAPARGDGEDLDALHRRRDERRPGHRHAGRPGWRSTPPCRRVLDQGDHAIVVAPYYATYPGTFRAAGADFTVVEAAAADGFQPRAEAIEAALQARTPAPSCINTPNNPTGAVYSRASAGRHRRLCREHDLWLLSDEVYWTLGGGEHVSPRALPGMAERTLVINSMSKSHGMTGWRIGWLTGPAEHDHAADQPQSGHHLRPDRLRLARRRRGAGERLWRRARSPSSTPARRTRLPRRHARHRTMSPCAARKAACMSCSTSRAIEPDDEKFAWALARRREGRRDAGLELRRGRRRPHPHQPLPARDVLQEAAARLRRFASSYRSKAA